MYTVKQISDLAQVSVRTLHYYDEIGLLTPSQVRENGYRYYDEAALLRLQQILFYREIGLELMQIKEILDSPNFDLMAALQSHRAVLVEKGKRLQSLIQTIDTTMMHLAGEVNMSKKRMFEGFSEEKQKEYEREARLRWGPENVNESTRRWNSYSAEKKAAIQEEGGQIYLDMAAAMRAGVPPGSDAVQAILKRWHEHLRYFYEPTLEVLRGLGELYNTDPDFMAFFQKIDPELTPYLQTSIAAYVDHLEDEELERLFAEDEGNRSRRLQG